MLEFLKFQTDRHTDDIAMHCLSQGSSQSQWHLEKDGYREKVPVACKLKARAETLVSGINIYMPPARSEGHMRWKTALLLFWFSLLIKLSSLKSLFMFPLKSHQGPPIGSTLGFSWGPRSPLWFSTRKIFWNLGLSRPNLVLAQVQVFGP